MSITWTQKQMNRIAALFIVENGCYYGVDCVDPWPKSRDAMKYCGPYPVIAHPPCTLWGNFAAINYKRWGGEHNRPGNDGGCFEFAKSCVDKFGGVLEHPAKTRAWNTYGIKKPTKGGWTRSGIGWVCEVWQSAYGHLANKATWLYYVGKSKPHDLDWSRPIGTHQIGYADSRGKSKNKPTVTKKDAIATPVLFRDELISLAMECR